ncbi:hypothetical protein C5C74_10870, partial [Rathayibacter sp. AY1E8]
MHAGAAPDGAHGARVTPVHLSAGFVFDSFEHARERFAGEDEGYLYTRNGNPTTEEVERRLADLEPTEVLHQQPPVALVQAARREHPVAGLQDPQE